MTKRDAVGIIDELERLGTAQNRKVYARHGYPSPCAGVSFAALGALKKRLGVDQALARELMASGHAEGQLLATMIADPAALDDAEARAWVEGVRWYVLADALAGALAAAPRAIEWATRWMAHERPWVRRTGYALVAAMLRDLREDLEDGWLGGVLEAAERDMAGSPGPARHAMNAAIIAIGGWRPALSAAALETARRIGPVEVDHGQTACETPDAVAYIETMLARTAGRAPAAKKKKKKKAKSPPKKKTQKGKGKGRGRGKGKKGRGKGKKG